MALKINPRGKPYSSLGVLFSGINHYVDAEVYRHADAEGIVKTTHKVPISSGRIVLNNTVQLPRGTKFVEPTFQLSKVGPWRRIGVDFTEVITAPLVGFDTYQAKLFSSAPIAEDVLGAYGFEVLVNGRNVEATTLDQALEPLQVLSKVTAEAIVRTGLTRAFGLL